MFEAIDERHVFGQENKHEGGYGRMLDRDMSGCKVWAGDCPDGNGHRNILIDRANSTWRAGAIVASSMVVVKIGRDKSFRSDKMGMLETAGY